MKHIQNRPLRHGMTELARQFPEGDEDEPPFGQPLMRNGQSCRADDDIFVEQDINVN